MKDLRDRLFSLRSYTPLPFLVLGLFFGEPTIPSLIGGIVIAIIGESIRFWGVGHASYETRVTGNVGASRLVVTGPFAYVRNPLYVGNILLYTGFAIMANRPWLTLLTAAWFIFQYMMIVSREEEFLAGKFGEEYESYRRAVPRFLPRLTPYQRGRDGKIAWDVAVRSERRTFQAFGIALLLMVTRLIFLRDAFL
jgi:protein-S-isoprenylcysteine O-methyltransferase Ste14